LISDRKIYLEVKFEVYGKVFEWKPCLNWSAEEGECDERIMCWFADCYDKAYADYQAAQFMADTERCQQAEEAAEREQLARLRKKYPDA